MKFRNSVTAVFTSCNRPDLLFKTLNSFFIYNSYQISKLIIVEDGLRPLNFLHSYPFQIPATIIATGKKVGQIAAIDYAYSFVDTEYIFHVEDDWEFYNSGFIEKSIRLLKQEDECIQVWLRALNDINGHPLEERIERCTNIFKSTFEWRKLKYDYLGVWHGFSFNPGLRRMSDYVDTKGYGIHFINQNCKIEEKGSGESAISIHYRSKNKFAAILADNNGLGYVKHIGWGRTVIDPLKGN